METTLRRAKLLTANVARWVTNVSKPHMDTNDYSIEVDIFCEGFCQEYPREHNEVDALVKVFEVGLIYAAIHYIYIFVLFAFLL